MKLQQLRYLREVARQGLNVSDAAEALFTSQPGISKQIRLLEQELGVDVFVRNGKRVVSVTEPGRAILAHIVAVAQSRGYARLSLETGSMEAFQPAQRLYQSAGFGYCGPFGDYAPDPNSVFMTKLLASPTASA